MSKQTAYHCHVSQPSDRRVLHVQDLPTLGIQTTAVATPQELQAVIADSGATAVNFYAAWMPRRAVEVAKITPGLLRRLWK